MTSLEFPTSQLAWEGINQYFCMEEKTIMENGGVNSSNELTVYNLFIRILKAKIDPDFDFGMRLGYSIKKWTKLVDNYVNRPYLDLVRNEIRIRESKKSKDYTYSYHFANNHGHGKDCLISIVFIRKPKHDCPILCFHTRASEITKRLIFDLLLVQRIGEYVYGEGYPLEIQMFAPMIYLNTEAFILFDNVHSITKMLSRVKDHGPQQKRIAQVLHKMKNTNPDLIKYKSHKRVALQVQRDSKGKPVSGKPGYLIRDCVLFREKPKTPKVLDLIERLNRESGISI